MGMGAFGPMLGMGVEGRETFEQAGCGQIWKLPFLPVVKGKAREEMGQDGPQPKLVNAAAAPA